MSWPKMQSENFGLTYQCYCMSRTIMMTQFTHLSMIYRRPPPTHTHATKQKDTETGTLECKELVQMLRNPDHKNVNKSKNRLTSFKL